MTGLSSSRVTPFGDSRISGCLLLPVTFRSLPRPSSPDSSEASSMDSFSLDHILSLPLFETPESTSRTPPLRVAHARSSLRAGHDCPVSLLRRCSSSHSSFRRTLSRPTATTRSFAPLPQDSLLPHGLPRLRLKPPADLSASGANKAHRLSPILIGSSFPSLYCQRAQAVPRPTHFCFQPRIRQSLSSTAELHRV